MIVGLVLAELIQAGRTAKEAEATASRLAGLRSSQLAKRGAVHQLRAGHLCFLLLACPDRVLERTTGASGRARLFGAALSDLMYGYNDGSALAPFPPRSTR